ncbi:unnamed protein product [Anisakis simplex]|uniref:Cholecystokinin receptor 2 (inferred by orthology to a C. elegans protein) n=1 Tax=Anisakis simplex TaxID=6269 RepID=A0A0M3JYE1_ANISI|nr:unnamed protein product [Anisakis simplex]
MTTVLPIEWSVNAYFGTSAQPSSTTAIPLTESNASSHHFQNVTSPLFANETATTPTTSMPQFELEDDCQFRPTTENYVTIVSFCLIFCLSVVGNSVVVVVIVQQRTMRSITNIYLLNLAISDLMLSVVCMPPTLVSSVIYCWMFGDILCKLFAYLQPVVVTASAYTLAVIAFERYYAICRPLHSRIWHTRSHAYAMISLVWIISVLANFFMLFMFELQTYNVNGLTCAPRYSPIIHFGYQIYMTSVLLLIPLFLMIALYGSVIHSLKMGMKMDIAAVEGSIIDAESRSVCIVLMSLMVNRLFISDSEVPFDNIVNERVLVLKGRPGRFIFTRSFLLRTSATDRFRQCPKFKAFDVWNSQLNTAITVLCYISSCANPITYCFLNQKFRSALLLTFGCRKAALHRHHNFQNVYVKTNGCSPTEESNKAAKLSEANDDYSSRSRKK